LGGTIVEAEKFQLVKRNNLEEVVVITLGSLYVLALVAVGVFIFNGDIVWGGAMIVGTILQLPRYAFTHAFFKIGLETAAAPTAVFADAGVLVFEAVVTVTESMFYPCGINIVGGLTHTVPLESGAYLIDVAKFVAESPKT
jgi:hypothetical protein